MTSEKTPPFIDDNRGSVLVEAGVVLPVFLLITFGVIYWGLTFWQQMALQHAVEMGARCATLSAGSNTVSNPYCGYTQCATGTDCASANAFLDNANMQSTQATTGSAICTYSDNYTNKFLIGLLPMLPTKLRASYCLNVQSAS